MSLNTHTGISGDVDSKASNGVLSGNPAHTMGLMPAQADDDSAAGIGTARERLPETTTPLLGPVSTGARNGVPSDVALPLRAAGNAVLPPVGVRPTRAPAPIPPTPRAAPAERARPDAGTGGRRSVQIMFLVFDGAARPEPTPTDVPGPERIRELAGWVAGVGNAPAPPPDPVTEAVSPAGAPETERETEPETEPPNMVSQDRAATERPAEVPRAVPQVEGSALSGLDAALMLTWLLAEPSEPPGR